MSKEKNYQNSRPLANHVDRLRTQDHWDRKPCYCSACILSKIKALSIFCSVFIFIWFCVDVLLSALVCVVQTLLLCEPPGGAELSEGDGVEGEHAPGLPGHLPPGGAAAHLHREAGGDGFQPGHPGVEEVASHRLPRAHAAAAG